MKLIAVASFLMYLVVLRGCSAAERLANQLMKPVLGGNRLLLYE
jgi:hypothetical protein